GPVAHAARGGSARRAPGMRTRLTSPRTAAVVITLVLTALVSFEVCGSPVQVSDSVGNLLQVQRQPLGDVFFSQFSNGAYVRPLLWAEFNIDSEAAPGR